MHPRRLVAAVVDTDAALVPLRDEDTGIVGVVVVPSGCLREVVACPAGGRQHAAAGGAHEHGRLGRRPGWPPASRRSVPDALACAAVAASSRARAMPS